MLELQKIEMARVAELKLEKMYQEERIRKEQEKIGEKRRMERKMISKQSKKN